MTQHEQWLAEFHALTLEALEIHAQANSLKAARRNLRFYQRNRHRDITDTLHGLVLRLDAIQDQQANLLIGKLRVELDAEQCRLMFKENGLL